MFTKKFWIPIILILIGLTVGTIFWGQHGTSQEPVKVYKAVEVQQSATPKPPPPGETYETGHWHGDEWHSEPHPESAEASRDSLRETLHYLLHPRTHHPPTDEFFKQSDGAESQRFPIADLPEETDYDLAVKGYVSNHFEKYPDCEDYEAVLSDAKLSAKWYLADLEHRKKGEALDAESSQIDNELHLIFSGSASAFESGDISHFYNQLNRMSDTEKRALIAKLEALHKQNLDLAERRKIWRQESPVYPKTRHTH